MFRPLFVEVDIATIRRETDELEYRLKYGQRERLTWMAYMFRRAYGPAHDGMLRWLGYQ